IRQGGAAGMSEKCDRGHYNGSSPPETCWKIHHPETLYCSSPSEEYLLQAKTKRWIKHHSAIITK
ncbi:hypothetical protein NL514_29330, partial [Klebsiella pneumoniae]|nr:hypothetical protein [Klebsiella pneumoniae]